MIVAEMAVELLRVGKSLSTVLPETIIELRVVGAVADVVGESRRR